MAELTVKRGSAQITIPFALGTRLREVLRAGGVELSSPCGGRGLCGKCAVTLRGAVSPPDPMEQRAGARLACRAVLLGDAEVILPREQEMEGIELGEDAVLPSLDPMEGAYGAAVDIGTTTLALRLYEMNSGTCLARCGMQNPQTAVAADVMGRIGAAVAGELDRLRVFVNDAVETLLVRACADAGIDGDLVRSLVVTGNTAMLYLFTGRDPSSLAKAPFMADHLFGETLHWNGRQVYLPRCMHAFVGADATCAVLASGMCEGSGVSLLSDVGTNGELALWKDGVLLVTSTAAGPAFEGMGISCGCGSEAGAIDRVFVRDGTVSVHTIGDRPAIGVCGSGLIDAVAAALAAGAIDETGAMEGEAFALTESVRLLPRDIRAVQLAKAAVAAGIDTLLETAGIGAEDVDSFLIAGGFGSHLNAESAAAIGLFPQTLAARARALGNGALTGAARMLLDRRQQARGIALTRLARHVDLGGDPKFNQHFIERMLF